MSTRDIFGELVEGVEAMREHREGKLTLRTHEVAAQQPPPVDAAYIRKTREKLHMSAAVFARRLRLSARTLEGWEQGRAPEPAAQVLIGLIRRYPDTLERIAELEAARSERVVLRKAAKKVNVAFERRTVRLAELQSQLGEWRRAEAALAARFDLPGEACLAAGSRHRNLGGHSRVVREDVRGEVREVGRDDQADRPRRREYRVRGRRLLQPCEARVGDGKRQRPGPRMRRLRSRHRQGGAVRRHEERADRLIVDLIYRHLSSPPKVAARSSGKPRPGLY